MKNATKTLAPTTTEDHFAAQDKRWANVDNPNDIDLGRGASRARQINDIATDAPVVVLNNVALYYEGKHEKWADMLAGKLRSAARQGANDNVAVRRAA